MTYTRISRQGKETFKDEREYQEYQLRADADAERRKALIEQGKKELALSRTEDQLKALYLEDKISILELEEGLNHIYGIEGGENNGGESRGLQATQADGVRPD